MNPDWILFDARCLQDPSYRSRGVGQHARCIVEAGLPTKRGFRFVAFTDASAGILSDEDNLLFDQVISALPTSLGRLARFIQLSPMTHLVQPILKILNRPAVRKSAIVYDFIQLIYPERYLGNLAERMRFVANLSALQNYDHYACISAYTADDLERLAPGARRRSSVSGVAVRASLQARSDEAPLQYSMRRHIVVAGGGDPRKNPECVVVAHARSRILHNMQIPMIVTGDYPSAQRNALRTLHRTAGGTPSLLEFADHLPDAKLRAAYRSAYVTVVPSFAEGFSIPVVEAIASATPVLVSDSTAHPELVPDRAYRFAPGEPEELRPKLEAIVADAGAWQAAVSAQSGILKEFTPHAVGERFWNSLPALEPQSVNGLDVAQAGRKHFTIGGARPRVAVVAPWPPSLSGVADHTAAFCREFGKLADVEVFTSTNNATPVENVAAIRAVSVEPYVASRFDATLSVIGNSHHTVEAFSYVLDYGGGALVHDARLIDFYYHQLGIARTLAIASKEAKRDVRLDELRIWLRDQSKLPVLFLSELAGRAEPFFVHSRTTADLMADLYARTPVVLPFAQYSDIRPDSVHHSAILSARAELGVAEDEKLIVSFGRASADKAPLECVRAVCLLKNRGRNVRLIFCGPAEALDRKLIENEAKDGGLGDRVTLFALPIAKDAYSRYLLAADAAVQLRTYQLGGLSGALNDCIAAAIPTVANHHLAEAMNAPGFVARVSDRIDASEIAEALDAIFNEFRQRPVELAAEYAADMSFARYSQLMFNHLIEDA